MGVVVEMCPLIMDIVFFFFFLFLTHGRAGLGMSRIYFGSQSSKKYDINQHNEADMEARVTIILKSSHKNLLI